jgi:hypothetical protein
VAVLEFPSDNSPTVLVEVNIRNVLSNKPSIAVLQAFHEITLNGHLSLGQLLGNGSYKLLALHRLFHSRTAQDAANRFFRGLKLYRHSILMGKSNIDQLEKPSTGVLVRICAC